jgi:glutamate formiminotransferase / 5-formyltetrahydrofolate cyclo-ligase
VECTRADEPLFECVVNVSEGRDDQALAAFSAAAGAALLDLHRDPDHNRAVLTLAGGPDVVAVAARALAASVVERLDLRGHSGAHPRLGVLDVVPFVPFLPGGPPPGDLAGAVRLRDDFARWLGTTLGVPAFLYGPLGDGGQRTLPEVRRRAFAADDGLVPDFGPAAAHPRAGATAVGARTILVAYNVWVSSVEIARVVAPRLRSPAVRALGLAVGRRAQVSSNLVDPVRVGPAEAYDAVARLVTEAGGAVEGAELVGLVPEVVLAAVPVERWDALGLSAESSIESRLRRHSAEVDPEG